MIERERERERLNGMGGRENRAGLKECGIKGRWTKRNERRSKSRISGTQTDKPFSVTGL